MGEIKVDFLHPTDGRIITVDVDDTMTASEAIAELLSADFIPSNPQGYNLAVKGGAQLQQSQSFGEAGVKTGNTVRILPAIDAGDLYYSL